MVLGVIINPLPAATAAATDYDEALKPAVQRIIGEPQHLEFNIRALKAAGKPGELLQPLIDSLKFAEGSAWSPQGYLVFSDIPQSQIYRFDPQSGEVSVAVSDFDQPNGICMSPDEARLYVADSGKPAHVRVFNVVDGRTLTNDRVFVEIDNSSPDGMCVDREGNLYVAAGDGVWVYSPGAERITTIATPKRATNVCFGGEFGEILFITAGNAVYQLSMPRAMRKHLEED